MSEERISVREMAEIFSHMERKVKSIVNCTNVKGGDDVEDEVFKDIYKQYKREFGISRKHPNLKRRYLYDAHDFIDSYELPVYLAEKVCG